MTDRNTSNVILARVLLTIIFLACLLLWLWPADAQEGLAGQGHDRWHGSFYMQLQRPDNGGSCCNLTDCRPTSGRAVDDHYEVKVNGIWITVLPSKIVRKVAPDLGFHVCAPIYNFGYKPSDIYCVIVPPEG